MPLAVSYPARYGTISALDPSCPWRSWCPSSATEGIPSAIWKRRSKADEIWVSQTRGARSCPRGARSCPEDDASIPSSAATSGCFQTTTPSPRPSRRLCAEASEGLRRALGRAGRAPEGRRLGFWNNRLHEAFDYGPDIARTPCSARRAWVSKAVDGFRARSPRRTHRAAAGGSRIVDRLPPRDQHRRRERRRDRAHPAPAGDHSPTAADLVLQHRFRVGYQGAHIVGLNLWPPPNALVIGIDEKSSPQALERVQGSVRCPGRRAPGGVARDDQAARRRPPVRRPSRWRAGRPSTATTGGSLDQSTSPYWTLSSPPIRFRAPAPRRPQQPQHLEAHARSLARSLQGPPVPLHRDPRLVAQRR